MVGVKGLCQSRQVTISRWTNLIKLKLLVIKVETEEIC